DPKRNREPTPFFIDPGSITPEDLIIAIPDLSQRMQDAIWQINRGRDDGDLLTAIETAEPRDTVPESTLHALQARIGRLRSIDFIKVTPKTMKYNTFSRLC